MFDSDMIWRDFVHETQFALISFPDKRETGSTISPQIVHRVECVQGVSMCDSHNARFPPLRPISQLDTRPREPRAQQRS